MKIELYLKNINQEMIDAGRKAIKPDDLSWIVSWPKTCCILDFTLVSPLDKIIYPSKYQGYMLRKEKEGGMFWDPRTGSVFKVDEEAYHTLIELNNGYSEREVAIRMNIPIVKVTEFISLLNKITTEVLK